MYAPSLSGEPSLPLFTNGRGGCGRCQHDTSERAESVDRLVARMDGTTASRGTASANGLIASERIYPDREEALAGTEPGANANDPNGTST